MRLLLPVLKKLRAGGRQRWGRPEVAVQAGDLVGAEPGRRGARSPGGFEVRSSSLSPLACSIISATTARAAGQCTVLFFGRP